MKRVVKVLGLVAVFMALALPALAQDGSDTGTDMISVVSTVAVVSIGIAYVVEWLRKRFPRLDGDVVRAISVVLAAGAVMAWDLRIAADLGYAGLPDILDAAVSAIAIAGGAGLVGSWKNAQRGADPTSSIHEA